MKRGSECSCTPVHCASEPRFALSGLRADTFQTDPRAFSVEAGSSAPTGQVLLRSDSARHARLRPALAGRSA
ncbi:hypothetical protein F7234_18655 [Pseudomonas putida]|nr:hypothetical protein F7234_18655 [Pseudomonas putida]RSC28517.1 hypothetical protein EGT09_19640 [Pseudomonas putida]